MHNIKEKEVFVYEKKTFVIVYYKRISVTFNKIQDSSLIRVRDLVVISELFIFHISLIFVQLKHFFRPTQPPFSLSPFALWRKSL